MRSWYIQKRNRYPIYRHSEVRVIERSAFARISPNRFEIPLCRSRVVSECSKFSIEVFSLRVLREKPPLLPLPPLPPPLPPSVGSTDSAITK